VGAANRKVKIKALNFPPERQAVKIIAGESGREKAAELVRVLHEESKII
jgi:electron transfer flavoprotein alpha/beta subunit